MKTQTAARLAGSTALARVPAMLAAPRPRAILSTPRADASPAAAIATLQAAFAEFKSANDNRLSALEKGRGDVLDKEKVDRINTAVDGFQAAIDDINKKIAAATLNGGGANDNGSTPERRAYRAAFNQYFRFGGDKPDFAALKELAVKAQLTRQSDPDGGYVVSPEIDKAIDRVLGTSSALRMLATVRSVGSATFKKRVGLGGATSGWVGENETRTETDTPRIAQLAFEAMTLYAEPEATEEMLEDADFDIEAWLADEVQTEFSEEEGAAFVTGNGVKRPRGLLDYDTVADANWEWGKLGYVLGGHATLLNDADKLIDMTTAVKQGFLANASWLSNRPTLSTVRKLKNSVGEYIWEPSLQVGQPASLLGYPTYTDDNMPAIGAGAFPMAFGDFRRGYLIADRKGATVLRNPFKTSGFVTFYTRKRVGGGVQHFQAIKLLKIAAA